MECLGVFARRMRRNLFADYQEQRRMQLTKNPRQIGRRVSESRMKEQFGAPSCIFLLKQGM